MPYKLDGLCVVKADTGEIVKCHPTKAKAMAHLHALQTNVSDAGSGSSKSKSSGGSTASKQMNEIMRRAAGKAK